MHKNELYINAMMYASAAFAKKNNGDVFCPTPLASSLARQPSP
jgi:hypothetical protein